MRRVDKFGWLKTLLSDDRFTEKEQRLGVVICVWFIRGDGTGWAVTFEDMAAKFGGMSHNRLAIALRKFVEYGYLEETGRSRGGRGLKAWRSHNLTKPHPARDEVSGETLSSAGLNPIQQRLKPYPALDSKMATEMPKYPPTGTSTGTSTGTGPIPEVPPPKTCTDHSDWNGPPCVRCQSDKRAYQTWLNDSRLLLSDLDREADTTRRHEADKIRIERRNRIAVFQRIGESWK